MDDLEHSAPQEPGATDDSAARDTSSRRHFIKTGATLTGGLLLSSAYIKPSMQSIALDVIPHPSSGSGGGQGEDDKFKKPKKPKKP